MANHPEAIDLACNLNYLGPPEGTHDFLRSCIAQAFGDYGSVRSPLARRAIANHVGVTSELVAHTNGATEALCYLPEILQQPRAVVWTPTFWQYAFANHRNAVAVTELELRPDEDFAYDLERLEFALRAGRAAVYLCSPNNPTCSSIDRDSLIRVAERHPDSDFVVDETYLPFCEDYDQVTLGAFVTTYPNIQVVQSFSKVYALPGLRSALLVARPDLIERFEEARVPYMASPVVDMVVPWLLNQPHYLAHLRREFALRRNEFSTQANRADISELDFCAPVANFVFGRITSDSSQASLNLLRDHGVVVREGVTWGEQYRSYFRFCLTDPEETDLLLGLLKN